MLLLDEPLTALDAKLKESLRDELAGLLRRLHITAIHVTHDQQEALAIADRLAVMQAGRIVQVGDGETLYRAPVHPFVATFLGRVNHVSPGMDLRAARQQAYLTALPPEASQPHRAHLRELLAPLGALPLYLLPGNHDDRGQLRACFPEHAYLGQGGFVQYSVAVGALQLIALDTVVPGASEGGLCAQRLGWLERELHAQRERPVVIAMHHPPFRTLIGHMDAIGLLEGAEALEAIVARHPNVERVVCGHLHRAIQVRFGGTLAATVPSPAHQVCLDLAPDAESAWTLEPPGFALHALPQGGRLVSHLAASGRYEGPYPFHDGGRLID